MASPTESFCFPVRSLENSRLMLVPFSVSEHAEQYVQNTKDHPHLFDFIGFGPFTTIEEFNSFYDVVVKSDEKIVLWAIMAKADEADEKGAFAGVVGLQAVNPANATAEIGHITIFPAFQRTFVTSNAVGLVLIYAMDSAPAGLGLRRCQYYAHAANEASKRLASRMQFTFEGVQRFERVVPSHKPSNGVDTTSLPSFVGSDLGPSRDSAMFAHYCDEWPEKREKILAVMDRRA